ncbi:GNAT family N-acetyltransferase [Paenibacillus xylanexedens]|uniref:GNAT family N-acetyltransferase n=1 Tax=Paenibacillus xylanexedens TaxID=528191 RepID=UPI0011AA9BB8|nr:GNAT family N-acetyltransferase [Paenibacillus xylanexedens]
MTEHQMKPEVRPVQSHEIQETIDFAMRVRSEVFPMMDHSVLPKDFEQFNEHYMNRNDTVFVIARAGEAGIIGSIGIVPYDGRIQVIEGRYSKRTAAEIVKCYVDPAYRRYGIGSLMVEELKRIVTKMEYTTLYLHTHRFLPGAVDFWERQGFTCITEEENEWQIVHMDQPINLQIGEM